MIGLGLRVAALMVAALLLVTLTLITAFRLSRETGDERPFRPPIPEQIVAIVMLLDAADASEAALLLRAIPSRDLRVRLRPGPLPADSVSDFPVISHFTEKYLETLGERTIWIGLEAPGSSQRSWFSKLLGEDGLLDGHPLRMLVQLRNGQVADFEIGGYLVMQAAWRQIMAATLLAVLLIGSFSLWGLRRQIQPLQRLATEVERLGTDKEGPPLIEAGAREVRQLVAAFNRLRGRIRDLLEARTRMLAAISHDLGTYLTRLHLRVDLIADEDQRRRAEHDLSDMSQLVRDMLALARLDHLAGQQQRLDLRQIVQAEVDARQESADRLRLHPGAPMWVRGDRLSLARAVSNLISNAIKYAGSVELELDQAQGMVELQVDDRGPGIAPEQRAAVLDPFFRGDQARNLDDGGSGLGLTIVADILRRHHGELQLEDRHGGGLRVRVRLPVA
ncbi:MAG: ATP-binding protein [Stagnimonas sp.]|nr:ATP-binding protein [Stagnimonas sp.]